MTPDGRWVACGGRTNTASVVHLDDWLAPVTTLGSDDLRVWGEILSSRRVEEGRDFRHRHLGVGITP